MLPHYERTAASRDNAGPRPDYAGADFDGGPTTSGTLPRELDGLYLHVSSAVEAGRGTAHLHAVRLCGGRAVWYRRRKLQCVARGTHESGVVDSAAALSPGLLRHAGSALVLGGGCPTLEVNIEGCVVGPFNFGGHVTDPVHPRGVVVADRNECHLLGQVESLVHFVFANGGRLLHATRLQGLHGRLLDFGATSRGLSVVIADDHGLAVHVADLGSPTSHRWRVPELPPRSSVQVINTFQEAGATMLDVIESVTDPAGRTRSRIARWVAWPGRPLVQFSALPDSHARALFATIDPTRVGQQHRFVVRASDCVEGSVGNPEVAVYDRLHNSERSYRLAFGRSLSEPVVASRATSSDELDGWLIVLVYDAVHDTSEASIFDMRQFPAPPVARVHLPAAVSGPGRGLWTPYDQRGRRVFQ